VCQNKSSIDNKYLHESPFAARGFHNFESTSQLPRHRWYHLKEGFSASLVEEAITRKLTGTDQKLHILEPFCGTGTTPLTVALASHFCTAIEVNPFLAFTARVKTTAEQWRKQQFLSNLDDVIKVSSKGTHSHLEGFSTFTERNGLKKWLFNRSVLRRFTSLIAAINGFGDIYADAMKLSALVAAYNCCNAKRDGKALRYKSNWRELRYSGKDLIKQFHLHALSMLQDVLEHPINSEFKPVIRTGDSRKELSVLEDDKFDLVVTSPPYLNSFDYSDIYRPELFLGEYVRDNDELKQIRLATVRSHIQVKWPSRTTFQSTLLNPVLEELKESDSLWDKRIPLMVRAYFDDMWRIFKAIKPKMRTNGQIWLVVSTSAYGGVHIPVDFIVADAANQAGFSLDSIHRLRHLRAAGQQWKQFKTKAPPLRESLIIMDNR
jgi:DNA modification methylase